MALTSVVAPATAVLPLLATVTYAPVSKPVPLTVTVVTFVAPLAPLYAMAVGLKDVMDGPVTVTPTVVDVTEPPSAFVTVR